VIPSKWKVLVNGITLRPVRGTGPVTKEHGVWVFHAGRPLSLLATDEILRQIRNERDLANLGERRMKGFFDTSVLVSVFYGDHIHRRFPK
jgi:hypothetical protein